MILEKFGTTELLSSRLESKGEFFASSGSTGTPTQILFSYPMHQRWSAAFEGASGYGLVRPQRASRHHRWEKGRAGRKVSSTVYRYTHFERQTYFSAYHIHRKQPPTIFRE